MSAVEPQGRMTPGHMVDDVAEFALIDSLTAAGADLEMLDFLPLDQWHAGNCVQAVTV